MFRSLYFTIVTFKVKTLLVNSCKCTVQLTEHTGRKLSSPLLKTLITCHFTGSCEITSNYMAPLCCNFLSIHQIFNLIYWVSEQELYFSEALSFQRQCLVYLWLLGMVRWLSGFDRLVSKLNQYLELSNFGKILNIFFFLRFQTFFTFLHNFYRLNCWFK